jgi:hypothetical protein
LERQLEAWSTLHKNDFAKRHIVEAVPEPRRGPLLAHLELHPELSPEYALRFAIHLCREDLRSLGTLYAHIASLCWTLRNQQPVETMGGEKADSMHS